MASISKWATSLMVLAAVVLMTGCPSGESYRGAKDKGGKKVEEHPHEGPHGGPIAEWGDEEYHAEFTVDHKTQSVKVYILGPDAKKPAPIKAEKVTLSIKKPPFQVELKPEKQKSDPEGTASVFVATDDRFGVEQEFEGTLSAEFDGKKYAGDFAEEGEHEHKDKKK